jgi:DNA-binding PadR family transcriptional regulator
MTRRPLGIEFALLGFLRDAPQHGYQIHQMLSDPTGLGDVWRLKQSQLYALLTKLENDGYLHSELEIHDAARPPRKMYRLTKDGRAAYQLWIKSPVTVPRFVRQEFMAKLYFARQEDAEKAKALIELQRAVCQQWLDEMKSKAELPSFRSLIQQYRIGQITATLNWLESL